MKMIPLLLASIFFLVFIYSSRKVWINPEVYIADNRYKRTKYSYLWSIFPFNYVAKTLERYPKLELWYSRIILLIMYLMIGFGLIVTFADTLR